ncbi:hypothetical protein EDB19DRAFT_1800771 [Suillus lakei]|nr:hypothetical protein EDB19DRAFT_1800771 [Suillus lakei]
MATFDESKFQALKNAISDTQPYCGGILTVPVDRFTLFYGKDATLGRIDLSQASEAQLQHLSQACDPATFGVNQQDVLDESYRKAGKLNVVNFATKFNLERSGLMDTIRVELLQGHNYTKPINAELYKLNVYGKGSFFKAHKDTPRGDRMFGSLVIVFPTPHEGGALTLRHGGKEWSFDSGKELAGRPQPSVGYVAFYSDVEHEVGLVKSGRRVTLTYNLFFAPEKPIDIIVPTPSLNELEFKAAFSSLLEDSSVLPNGGKLGFGLRHEYPVNVQTDLTELIGCLKGGDALIYKVCTQLSLDASLKVVYRDDDSEHDIMIDGIANLEGAYMNNRLSFELQEHFNGRVVYSLGHPAPPTPEWVVDGGKTSGWKPIEVYWVTPMTTFTSVREEFIIYGNEASLGHCYGDICLVVDVEPADDQASN